MFAAALAIAAVVATMTMATAEADKRDNTQHRGSYSISRVRGDNSKGGGSIGARGGGNNRGIGGDDRG